MSKKPKASVLNMIERERHRVAASVTKEQDWEQPEPNNGLARMFVIMLLIHVFVIGGIIIYDFVGGDSTPKSSQASSAISSARSTSTAASVPAAVPLLSQAPLAAPKSTTAKAATPEAAHTPKAVPYTQVAGSSSTPIVVAKATFTDPLPPASDLPAFKPATASATPTHHVELPQPKTVTDKPRPVVADSPPGNPSQPRPVMTPSAARRALEGDSRPPSPLVAKKRDKEDADAPPAKKTDKPASAHSASKYTVVKGDTFYKLARRYKTTEDALMKANGIKNANALVLGKTITIPAAR